MAVDKSETRVRRMFAEIALRYDFLNHLLSFGVDRHWRRQTVRRVPLQGTAPVLDLCTGTGDLALAYAHRMPLTGSIIGTDFCHEMLTIGRDKASRAGYDGRLAFIEADAQRLPFPDDQFQIVCVAFGLRNITNTDLGLREMVRVCQPGGRVAVLEFSMPRLQPVRGLYRWFFRRVLPRVGQAVSRSPSRAYNYLPESVGEFPDGEALSARMQTAGLHRVEFWSLTGGIATLYVGTK
ncbi:MAG TPA: bifunctional demethylmenaquinone methyltransferase/2-methoxy-6-polyprenyl-1,4-benzoquinol methylase UbiE [Pirellulales bacterium]|nr:bifunctional demethylmenaquinone methyltransferase/2-methoxy-6-polyprenyl-1,4-benzoquinol methylase UbiE [Pirellulales bacterium]